jgi:hypothetical protein
MYGYLTILKIEPTGSETFTSAIEDPWKLGLKAVFHYAKFFDRIEISLCFMSSRAEPIVKRQREISFRSKNSASWNQALSLRNTISFPAF